MHVFGGGLGMLWPKLIFSLQDNSLNTCWSAEKLFYSCNLSALFLILKFRLYCLAGTLYQGVGFCCSCKSVS